MATRIEKTDLARDALYNKVNTMIDEVNTKIDNKDSLPSQTGNAGKFLTTDGTNASWGKVKQIEIKQNLTNPSTNTVPSTKAVSDESSRITTLMNNKVSKYGDTMTGNLIINGNIPAYILQDSTLDLSQTFTDNRNDSFLLERDKNGRDGGFITFRHDKYDANITEVCASNGIDPNRKIQSIGIWVRKNGEHGTYAPKCSFDNSILTNVTHGTNYVRFGNGLQICWGSVTVGDGAEVYQNLPQAFKDTNYIVTFGHQNFTNNTTDFYHPQLVNGKKNTTNFTVYCRNAGSYHNAAVTWIAIGYWY